MAVWKFRNRREIETKEAGKCGLALRPGKVVSHSCRTTLNRKPLIWSPPLCSSTKPKFLKLFVNKLTRGRVMPIPEESTFPQNPHSAGELSKLCASPAAAQQS